MIIYIDLAAHIAFEKKNYLIIFFSMKKAKYIVYLIFDCPYMLCNIRAKYLNIFF